MFNISKAYVRLLGHALGYHFSSKDGFDVDVLGPGEYIDIVRVYEWLNDLTAKVEDPDLGLKAFGNAHPAMLGVLGYAVMSCSTLGHALERLVKYHPLISNGSFLKVEFRGKYLKVLGFEVGDKPPRVFIDSGASVFLGLMQWLVPNQAVQPVAAEFTYTEPVGLNALKAIFGKNITFSSASNSLLFRREVYDYPLISASPTLNVVHTDVLNVYLQNSISGLMSSRIKKIVSDGLLIGCIPTVQTVSRAMKMSARTLQNYLQREETTFTAIFEASRKELARHLLKDSAYNLKYICATLGFCDKSSFHKASLRWFGMTPQKYRELAE